MPNSVKAADLENGNVLMLLKNKFYENPTEENLYPLLLCLRDSVVKVPFIAQMSDNDKERFANLKDGENFTNKDEIKLTADILKNEDGEMYFPIFSQDEQIPEDYSQQFTVVPITVLDAVKMAHSDGSLSGLVLDAFTSMFAIPFNLADYMVQLPSRLDNEEKE